jgi:hypothetical protein
VARKYYLGDRFSAPDTAWIRPEDVPNGPPRDASV